MAHNSLDPASSIPVDARIVRNPCGIERHAARLAGAEAVRSDHDPRIARDAGIGYATFFRHYPTKEALLNDLAADQIRELLTLAFPILYEPTAMRRRWCYVPMLPNAACSGPHC